MNDRDVDWICATVCRRDLGEGGDGSDVVYSSSVLMELPSSSSEHDSPFKEKLYSTDNLAETPCTVVESTENKRLKSFKS